MFFNKAKEDKIASMMEQDNKQDYWSIVRRQFRKNRLAVWALRFFYIIAFVGIFADFIANDKPLYCVIDGETHFPVFKEYAVGLGISNWDEKFIVKKWHEHEYESAIFPPITYLPSTLDFDNKGYKSPFDEQKLLPNYGHHLMGTDHLGRDVAAGMIHGTRTAMLVGIVAMSIALLIGLFFGAISGYFGDDRLKMSRMRVFLNILALILSVFYAFIVRGFSIGEALATGGGFGEFLRTMGIFSAFIIGANILAIPFKKVPWLGDKVTIAVDILIMRLIEIVNSIPTLILILAIVAVLEKSSIVHLMVIIGLVSWTGIAKFLRAELLRVRRLEYIEAAQAFGYSELRIILRHAIPNALAPVLIAVAFGVASAVLTEAFLSFLTIGVPPDQVTWGSMLNASRNNLSAWWLTLFPGIGIFFTVTIFNLLGEGLSDALDPRTKQ